MVGGGCKRTDNKEKEIMFILIVRYFFLLIHIFFLWSDEQKKILHLKLTEILYYLLYTVH